LDSSLFVSQRNIPYRRELDASVVSASHEGSSRNCNVGKAVEGRVRPFHEITVRICVWKSAVRGITPIIAFSAARGHVALLRKSPGRPYRLFFMADVRYLYTMTVARKNNPIEKNNRYATTTTAWITR
jgi:hypothetical protein